MSSTGTSRVSVFVLCTLVFLNVRICTGQYEPCPVGCQRRDFECVCPNQPDPPEQNPSAYTQPLFACLMNVADLPEYDGYPTPEMQAAAIGISASIAGMLEPWFISNTFPVEDWPGWAAQEAQPRSAAGSARSNQNSSRSTSPAGESQDRQHTPTTAAPDRGIPYKRPPERQAATQQAPKANSNTRPTRPQRPVQPDRTGRSSNALAGNRPVSSSRSSPSSSDGSSRGNKAATGRNTWGGPAFQTTQPAAPAATAPPVSTTPPAGGGFIIPRPAAPAAASSTLSSVSTAGQPNPPTTAAVAAAAASVSAESSTAAAASRGNIAAVDKAPSLEVDQSLVAAAAAAAGSSGSAGTGAVPAVADTSRAVYATAGADSTASADAATTAERKREAPSSLPTPNTLPKRELLQTSSKPEVRTCNKGTYTKSDPSPYVRRSFTATYGEVGINLQSTNVVPPDPTLAVGPYHALHVVNSLVKIIPLTSSGNVNQNPRPGEQRTIPLPDFFALVASPCDGGYIYPWAAYDKEVGRFLLTCICGGDSNQVLLAISTTSSATGTWILYAFDGEVTAGSQMQCNGYPVSVQSQVTYNRDGVYLTWVQNCPDDQDLGTGAILAALPKWAVYKGATWFWAPVWTAWDIYDGINIDSDAYYPGAFLQLQPVMPQRAEDVQAEVVYFVMDNLNYVQPLQRTEFTLVSLFNTGSLWLFEGPNSNSPNPFLVSRVINRGVSCLAVPDTKLIQPLQVDNTIQPTPQPQTGQCAPLDAGSMRPPGFWEGGAALYANQIYLANRGPDITSNATFINSEWIPMPTIYWAVLTPSFCVSGPCAPWFGTDWGWDDGWNWQTGTWDDTSERAKNPYSDPAYYNQVFLFPSGSTSAGPIAGRPFRRLQQTHATATGSVTNSTSGSSNISSSSSSSSSSKPSSAVKSALRDAAGVLIPPDIAAMINASHMASEIQARLGPNMSRQTMAAAVKAALDRMDATKPSAEAAGHAAAAADGPAATAGYRGSVSSSAAYPAPEVVNGDTAAISTEALNASSSSRDAGSSNRTVSVAAPSLGDAASAQPALSSGSSSSSNSGSSSGPTAQNVFLPGVNYAWGGFTGWGWDSGVAYYNYFQFWREHYFLRNLYMNLRIPPKVNPCKYYKDWLNENSITFGAIVSRRGVLDYVSVEENPVGVAYPQVAVAGGVMLVVYSFSGPYGVPNVGDPNILAYPGIGYSVIPPDKTNGNFEINYAKLPGNETNPGCIKQYGVPLWGAYSGIDVHPSGMKVLSAVETSWGNTRTNDLNTNAATWINVFT